MDAIDICVPTPLRKTKDPDLSYIVLAVEAVAATLRRGQLDHPRVDDLSGYDRRSGPADARGAGAEGGRRFLPRVFARACRPGNQQFNTKNIPKIVGGVGPASTEAGGGAVRGDGQHVVPVSSTRVAEMVKLLENTFRAVNIGLVNEIALMCHKMDIDVWEVIDAAKTKPFGFMPFYPGPGLGRALHSDRSVLSVVEGAANGFECRFIELAGQINSSMPHFVVDRVAEALNCVKSRSTDRAFTWSVWPTSATSTTCASRRRSTCWSCWRSAARG